MALSTQVRERVRRAFEARVSRDRTPVNVTSADVLAALEEIDTQLDVFIPALNAALPEPARSQLSNAVKVRLFTLVLDATLEEIV